MFYLLLFGLGLCENDLLYTDKLEQLRKEKELAHDLLKNDIMLTQLVEMLLEKKEVKHLYLIIDQFEELFTLTKEVSLRNTFLDQLLLLINSDLHVTLILSMRADFLSHISYYDPFNKAYNTHPSQMLSLLSPKKLRRIIESPAKKLGVGFQEGLVKRIIEEIENEAGQLPLLEFALEQFWTNKKGRIISHAVLDEMESISHSISHYADKVYARHPKYHASIKKVLIKLVNPGSGTEDTRRIASFDEFDKEARKTITLLANERLVITEDGNIDIVHEALIREWKRLEKWINHYRDFLEWEKHLRDDRKFYVNNGEKKEDLLVESKLLRAKEFLESHEAYISPLDKGFVEKSIVKAKEKMKIKIIGLSLIFVFLFGVIGVIFSFWKDSEKQKEKVQNMLYESGVDQGITERDYLKNPIKSKLIFSNLIKSSLNKEQEDNAKILYNSIPNNIVLSQVIDERILYADEMNLITSKDKVLKVWALNDERVIQTFDLNASVDFAIFNKNRSKILTVSDDNVTRSWDALSGKLLQKLEDNTSLLGAIFTKDDKKIVTWNNESIVKVWDTEKGIVSQKLKSNILIDNIILNNNMTKLFLQHRNITEVWDILDGQLLKTISNAFVIFNKDKNRMLIRKGIKNHKHLYRIEADNIELWDIINFKVIFNLKNKLYLDMAFNRDGDKLVFITEEDIEVLDSNTGKILKKIKINDSINGFIKNKDNLKFLLWTNKTIQYNVLHCQDHLT